MKSFISALACSVLTTGLAAGLASAAASEAVRDVVREGAGDRRATLNAMELKSFDHGLLSQLTGWTSPISAGETSGKVVLLVTWASWYTASHQVLPLAQKLADQHAGDLVVVGIHHPQGFKNAVALAKSRGVSFPIAHDANGKVREALHVDQDPDFYVIDRAGQMRYADIATSSVTEAVERLIAESRNDAATLNARIDEAQRIAEENARRTGTINQEIDLRSLGEVPFTPPTEAEWAAVKLASETNSRNGWPEMPEDNRSRRRDEPEERTVALPESMPMLPSRPATKGRAVVLYFWHPLVPRTVEPTLRDMELLQKQKGRDVAVIGVLVSTGNRSSRRDDDDETNDPGMLGRAFRNTPREFHLTHTIAFNVGGELFDAAFGNSGRGSSERFALEASVRDTSVRAVRAPVVVLSSDNKVRWFGDSNDPAFAAALNRVLRVDPGVRARREAEADYIRTQGR